MSTYRFHNKKSFFKYTSAQTARLVLRHTKLRWSAPSQFNDPFDVPSVILEDIDEGEIRNALSDRLDMLVENPQVPDPDNFNAMAKYWLNCYSRADANLKKQFIEANEESRQDPKIASQSIESIRDMWQSMYNDHRILCLAEHWDSASMWDRYSEGHQGVVIELACLGHFDSAWFCAKPVRYTDEPFRYNTPKGVAELTLYDPTYASLKIMEEYTLVKTKDWEYEHEWRVASWKRPHESGDYNDYGFAPAELKGVIFGARTSDPDRGDMLDMIRRSYPHAQLWQATIGNGRKLKRQLI